MKRKWQKEENNEREDDKHRRQTNGYINYKQFMFQRKTTKTNEKPQLKVIFFGQNGKKLDIDISKYTHKSTLTT